MGLLETYQETLTGIMKTILEQEKSNISLASDLLAECYAEDRLIHIFGAGGHSAIAAMEVFWRAGGLTKINAMFPAGTNIISANPTTAKITGLAPYILNYYDVHEGDPLILVNFYGLNPIAVDVALEAKKKGIRLITVNSHGFAHQVPEDFKWRHPSKKNIHELADVAVDNHVPYPDAVLNVPGIEETITPTATIVTCFVLNCIMTETICKLVEKGVKPEIWISNNIPGCDEHNNPLVDKYKHRIHHLYPVV
ncbi:MAG: sugar isomerase domain-containing protein [Lentisphaeria bacterium]